ncbi:CGNR zinc finger domain-containing protein [Mycobacterium mantenii]|uniref:Peptide chain release factor 2 n=1 Tax=Mycobacterium mantenii TaxID=560555 RepID=A0A1X0FYK9_MYCNT|nr:CGNR zinc finger domain-containing protein [Mycobacterium mantenii]MCV7246638.1 CGNR zinc finger domain-containing protein [Mycobacterium mantenii]ORB06796.1 peptide chain release factor 2 [Mycobacterium mantenii]
MVQDFLNTRAIDGYGPDLLANPENAGDWAATAVRAWSSVRDVDLSSPELRDADLVKLRALRTTIGRLVAGEPPSRRGVGGVGAFFTLSDAGEVRLDPSGSGWRWLASALWGEILLSQQAGTWRRIKRCHNHRCGSTFYDRSKNNSGVWHDVKTCGNAVNLRASRARRRERDRAAGSGLLPEQAVPVVETPPDAGPR